MGAAPRVTPATYRRRRVLAAGVAVLSIGGIVVIARRGSDAATSASTSVSPSSGADTSPLTSTLTSTGPDASSAAADTTGSTDSTAPASSGPTTSFAPPADGLAKIDVKAYAIYDATRKVWLAERQGDAPLPVGSIMKLLTADVVMRSGPLSTVVTVPALHIDPAESAIGLRAGEQLTREQLLEALLVVSAGDAALTLATDVGGSEAGFVDAMNAEAQRLGLTTTVARNPIGLDQTGAHSSARDVVKLAAKLMQDATFRRIVVEPSVPLHGTAHVATDKLLSFYPGANGVKTGHTTRSGWSVVSSATRNGRTMIVAVLGAPSEQARFSAAKALLDWAFQHPG